MEVYVHVDAQTLIQPEIKAKRKKVYIFLTILALITFSISGVFGVSAYVGWNLTHPVRQQINNTPLSQGLPYKNVVFTSRGDNLKLKGWLIPANGSTKTVIFAHGYRKNRLQNDVPSLPIAKALVSKGYNVLMFDFRNSGQSEGKLTSVGQYEVQDLLGAVDFIKSRPEINKQIVLFGFSMGASTAILAGAREPAVSAVIADSPFADLKTYLSKNLSVWTELPSVPFNQTFFMIVPALTGLKPETVSPVKEIHNLNSRPILLIHGEADEDIPIENSELLQRNYPQAKLLRVPGAKHVKSFTTDQNRYLYTVSAFLETI
ncbi:MAG: alpha/beta fold hydrolase [Syntrophomonas sp.]